MRIFLSIALFLFVTVVPAFATDIVNTAVASYNGRLVSFSDGLVRLHKDGIDHSFTRTKGNDYYGDYVVLRKSPFRKDQNEVSCRVSYVDSYTVVYVTPVSRVKLPRYRVSKIILDTK